MEGEQACPPSGAVTGATFKPKPSPGSLPLARDQVAFLWTPVPSPALGGPRSGACSRLSEVPPSRLIRERSHGNPARQPLGLQRMPLHKTVAVTLGASSPTSPTESLLTTRPRQRPGAQTPRPPTSYPRVLLHKRLHSLRLRRCWDAACPSRTDLPWRGDAILISTN